MKLLRHIPDRPVPRGGSWRGLMPSPRPAGRGAVPAGTRGAGLAATIFDISSRPVVGGAAGNPVGGADAAIDETPNKDR